MSRPERHRDPRCVHCHEPIHMRHTDDGWTHRRTGFTRCMDGRNDARPFTIR